MREQLKSSPSPMTEHTINPSTVSPVAGGRSELLKRTDSIIGNIDAVLAENDQSVAATPANAEPTGTAQQNPTLFEQPKTSLLPAIGSPDSPFQVTNIAPAEPGKELTTVTFSYEPKKAADDTGAAPQPSRPPLHPVPPVREPRESGRGQDSGYNDMHTPAWGNPGPVVIPDMRGSGELGSPSGRFGVSDPISVPADRDASSLDKGGSEPRPVDAVVPVDKKSGTGADKKEKKTRWGRVALFIGAAAVTAAAVAGGIGYMLHDNTEAKAPTTTQIAERGADWNLTKTEMGDYFSRPQQGDTVFGAYKTESGDRGRANGDETATMTALNHDVKLTEDANKVEKYYTGGTNVDGSPAWALKIPGMPISAESTDLQEIATRLATTPGSTMHIPNPQDVHEDDASHS